MSAAKEVYLRLSAPHVSRWVSFISMSEEMTNKFMLVWEWHSSMGTMICSLEGGDPEFSMKRMKLSIINDLKEEKNLQHPKNSHGWYRKLRKGEDETESDEEAPKWQRLPSDLFESCILYMVQDIMDGMEELQEIKEVKKLTQIDEEDNKVLFEYTFAQTLSVRSLSNGKVWINLKDTYEEALDMINFLYEYMRKIG